MALWDQLKSRTQTMSTQLKSKSDQFRSKEFAAGSMAMCALVAAADGTIDAAERSRTASLIGNNDVLKNFPAADLQQKFDFYCDKLGKDYSGGTKDFLFASIAAETIQRLFIYRFCYRNHGFRHLSNLLIVTSGVSAAFGRQSANTDEGYGRRGTWKRIRIRNTERQRHNERPVILFLPQLHVHHFSLSLTRRLMLGSFSAKHHNG